MKKVLVAVVIGAVLGFAASAATSTVSTEAAGSCGPRVCGANQECCVSPGPRTYTCVPIGHCRWN